MIFLRFLRLDFEEKWRFFILWNVDWVKIHPKKQILELMDYHAVDSG